MLLRRLYSSLPSGAIPPAAAAAPAKPRAATRGRLRPTRVSLKRKVTPPPVATSSTPTHGRRLRRGNLSGRGDLFSSEVPFTPGGFQPVSLYPSHAGLHLSLTPSHMPLPLNLGVKGYLAPAEAGSLTSLFEGPSKPAPSKALPAVTASSTLGEHISLSRAFAHPALAHHLGSEASHGSLTFLPLDDSAVNSTLEAARMRHTDAATNAWEATLSRLGQDKLLAPVDNTAEQSKIDDALASLDGLLARLDASASDEHVSLDSVKRKRKKKINKHKYKKRRKATRALRKRLGK